MFNKLIILSAKPELDFLLKLVLSTAALCVISPYIWTISPEYDVMFGSLMVCAVPTFFGWRIGSLAVALYLCAGAFGLPVFAGHHGGLDYFIPENGFHTATGYLFGYLMAALIVGFIAEKLKPLDTLKLPLLFIIGHAIIITLGFLHLYRIPNYELDVLGELKNLLPSFLIKMGIFTVIISMIGRKLAEQEISAPVDLD